jgi:hypothetical protein
MSSDDLDEINVKAELQKINDKGYIKTLRNADTGIGKTLETELGIVENNNPHGDLKFKGKVVELKAQRKNCSSNITLFTFEPRYKKYSDAELLKKYGYKDKDGRVGLKITMKVGSINNQGFTLKVDEEAEKINIVHVKDGKEEIIWSYSFENIQKKLESKLATNLLIVLADSEKREDEFEYFHYNVAYLLSDLSSEKFAELIDEGKIVVEFRMHLKPSGIARNHGTGFRLNEKYIADLYDDKEVLM